MTKDLLPFFNPRGVAIIGASSNPKKVSHGIVINLKNNGYQGKIYPVNPSAETIAGLPCFDDISKVPDPLDLGVIILPAAVIPASLEACGRRGLKAVTVISGGFKEVGQAGADLEEIILGIAKKYSMRLLGPNCVGTMDLYTGLNTTFIKGVPERGHIGFLSQSGALGGGVIDYAIGYGGTFSRFVSLGNEANITETDMIEVLAEDPNTNVIALYVESILDGQRFISVASQVTQHKPIVVLKGGRSEAGARAVSSHTGSIAGSNEAYQAAFKQSGVIQTQNFDEFYNLAVALATQPQPNGNKSVIITNAGGPAALASDSLENNGLQLANLNQKSQQTLREKLNPSAQVNNPVDMLGGAEPEDYHLAISAALDDDDVDSVIVIHVPTAVVDPCEIAEAVCDASRNQSKPILTCLFGGISTTDARQILNKQGIPVFTFPEAPGRTLGLMAEYHKSKSIPAEIKEQPFSFDHAGVNSIINTHKEISQLNEALARPIFSAYGLPLIPGDTANNVHEAIDIANELGYPVVVKIISNQILHKTDVGAVQVNLTDQEMVNNSVLEMMEQIRIAQPDAAIQGILVEKMAPDGFDVILGMRRDPNFGPLMMFGLGGIYVELAADISFRVAPINYDEIKNMVFETSAGKILSGARGRPAADIDAVVECVFKLSKLTLDFPSISEMEINPLRVFSRGQGAAALDARIILANFDD